MNYDRMLKTNDIQGAQSKRTIKNNFYSNHLQQQSYHGQYDISSKDKTGQDQRSMKDSLDNFKESYHQIDQKSVPTFNNSQQEYQNKQKQMDNYLNQQKDVSSISNSQWNQQEQQKQINQLSQNELKAPLSNSQHEQQQKQIQDPNQIQKKYLSNLSNSQQNYSAQQIQNQKANSLTPVINSNVQSHNNQDQQSQSAQILKKKIEYNPINNNIFARQCTPIDYKYIYGNEIQNLKQGSIPKIYPQSYKWHPEGTFRLQPDVQNRLLINNQNFLPNNKNSSIYNYTVNRTHKNAFDYAGQIYGLKNNQL